MLSPPGNKCALISGANAIHAKRHGTRQNLLTIPAPAKAAANLRERTVRDITAKEFAELHQAESATWQEGVKEYFQ
jgi:hypothetical protein